MPEPLCDCLLDKIHEQIERTEHLIEILPTEQLNWAPEISGAWSVSTYTDSLHTERRTGADAAVGQPRASDQPQAPTVRLPEANGSRRWHQRSVLLPHGPLIDWFAELGDFALNKLSVITRAHNP